MKRLLPLILLSLLLLAPAARGSGLEEREKAIQDVAVQVEFLLDELDKTEDPQKRAALQAQIDTARAYGQTLETELESVRGELAAAAKEHAALSLRAEAMFQRVTALHSQVEAQRKAFVDKGDLKRVEAMEPEVQLAAQNLGEMFQVRGVLARTEGQLRKGELSGARHGLGEADGRMDDVQRRMREDEKERRMAPEAEHAAEDAQRTKSAAQIAVLMRQAEAGIEQAKRTRARLEALIKRASELEDAAGIQRIQQRWADFEEHAAQFHSAKALLEQARAHFEAARVQEAQKTLLKAKEYYEKARRRALDDGSEPQRPAPEFRTQRALVEALFQRAASSLSVAQRARESLAPQLREADAAGEQEEAERLRAQAAKLADEAARLEQVREKLEKARALIDGERYAEAKQAFEQAQQRLEKLEALRARLGDVTEKSDRPFEGAPAAKEDPAEALRKRIAELEAELAILSEKVTDRHSDYIALAHRIELLKKRLAARTNVDAQGKVRIVTDEDGRYVYVGETAGDWRLRLVTDGDVLIRGRIVTGDGVVVSEPVTVEKTVRSVVRRSDTPQHAELRERIDHLREAAKHLREAGQAEQAEQLEQQSKELEASLSRTRVVYTGGADGAQVMRAVGELHQEVRALRKEVKELKELILQGR